MGRQPGLPGPGNREKGSGFDAVGGEARGSRGDRPRSEPEKPLWCVWAAASLRLQTAAGRRQWLSPGYRFSHLGGLEERDLGQEAEQGQPETELRASLKRW